MTEHRSAAADAPARNVWAANAPFDAWHVNCATRHEGRLYATAFGRFDQARGWNLNCDGTGILFDTATGEDVVTGSTQPHTPRWIDGAWTVCDSGSGAVVRVAADEFVHWFDEVDPLSAYRTSVEVVTKAWPGRSGNRQCLARIVKWGTDIDAAT